MEDSKSAETKVSKYLAEKIKTSRLQPISLAQKVVRNEEKHGITELKDTISLAVILVGTIIEVSSEEIGPLDILDLLRKDEIQSEIGEALSGIQNVSDEALDLNLRESLELGRFVMSELKKHV